MKTMKLVVAALAGTLLAGHAFAQDKPKELVVGIDLYSDPAIIHIVFDPVFHQIAENLRQLPCIANHVKRVCL